MANKKSSEKKPNFIQKIGKFFSDTKAEIKKTVWPKSKAVFKSTGVVLSCIIISSIFVGILDFALTKGLSTIISMG